MTNIADLTQVSAITIVLIIMLVASMNGKRNSLESSEPMSERRVLRDSLSEVYEYDDSWIHPAWLASLNSEWSQLGQPPLVTPIPPALSALNTANAREKRLHLVRHSLLNQNQRVDRSAFEDRSWERKISESRQKQRRLERERRSTSGELTLWL